MKTSELLGASKRVLSGGQYTEGNSVDAGTLL